MRFVFSLALLACTLTAYAGDFSLSSTDMKSGQRLDERHVYYGFGCAGANLSPALSWRDVPAGTKSLALVAHDPDAPGGGGWYHWIVYDIPASTHALQRDAGNDLGEKLPRGAQQADNSFDSRSYGGACPPKGHGVHHYNFTLYALKVAHLKVDRGALPVRTEQRIREAAIASTTFTAIYER
ncbi:YbhB/YbcL family Raf kinase inhibitor-like protein [Chitinibacteraceae bacterium HSL-7]